MKFKIYEVKLGTMQDRVEEIQSFLFAEYEDAVSKFKKLIEEQKKVDWIMECLNIIDTYEGYDIDLIETMDMWAIYVDGLFSRRHSKVTIIEREVF